MRQATRRVREILPQDLQSLDIFSVAVVVTVDRVSLSWLVLDDAIFYCLSVVFREGGGGRGGVGVLAIECVLRGYL